MKQLRYAFFLLFFGLLVAASFSLPPRGDPDAPASRVVSDAGSPTAAAYYLENSYKQTHTDNMVTAVLADYRAFDTLGETLVVFVAGVACALLLQKRNEPPA